MNGRSAVGHDADTTGHLGGIALKIGEGLPAETARLKDKAESRITAMVITCGLLIIPIVNQESYNAGLQLGRAISIGAEGKLLEKHAVAPSAEQAHQDFTMLARLEVRSLNPCKALLSAAGDRLLRRSVIGPTVCQHNDA